MKTNELVSKLGEAIRKKREKLGISRDDLARQIGKTVILDDKYKLCFS